MNPEQDIQTRIATQIGLLFIQNIALQAQIETMNAQWQAAMAEKPQEVAAKAEKK